MSFGLALLFVFLVLWRPQEWLFPWLFNWPLLDMIVYTAIIALVMESQSGLVRAPRTPAVSLLIGLWVATLLSHIPHTYFQGFLDTFFVSLKPCFIAILLIYAITSIDRLRIYTVVIVFLCCVMSVHALLQVKYGYGFMGQEPLYVYVPDKGVIARTKFFGIFDDPNDLGQMLASAIPLAFAIPRRMNMFTIPLAAGAACLLFLGLLETHSRGGMVALLAAGAIVVVLFLPARWMPWLLALMVAGFLVAVAITGAALLDASARERVVFWGMANYAFKDNPLFGVGYGMFWQVAGDRAAHNAFVSCYTEIGIVGYWFWFGLMQLGLLGCWRTRLVFRKPQTVDQAYMKRVAGLSIASMVGYAAGAYFLSGAFVFPMFFMFALVNAVPLIAMRLRPANAAPLIDLHRDVLVWGTITSLASIVYIYISIILLNR